MIKDIHITYIDTINTINTDNCSKLLYGINLDPGSFHLELTLTHTLGVLNQSSIIAKI
jgi:hypothetical protein